MTVATVPSVLRRLRVKMELALADTDDPKYIAATRFSMKLIDLLQASGVDGSTPISSFLLITAVLIRAEDANASKNVTMHQDSVVGVLRLMLRALESIPDSLLEELDG